MTKFNFREAFERIDVINGRLNEMAENLESDKERDAFTEAEQAEIVQLRREKSILEARVQANKPHEVIEVNRGTNVAEANKRLRESIKEGKRVELRISRAVASDFGGNASGYSDEGLTSTNPFGLTTGDIVEPLYAMNILSAIGAPLLTGLKGNYQWPVVETFSATINDEAVALGDTKIPLSKLIAKPERLGLAVPVTREAMNETEDLLQTICTKWIPVAVADLMNQIMFSTEKVAGATNLVGPFVNCLEANKLTYSGDAPTLKELLTLKGTVLGANIRPEGLCYVMTETTKAMLEGTPKWDGASLAIVDDSGRINGVPVFTSSHVEEGTILFGSFKYAPQGIFGDMSMIIDPYTLARKNAIDFVINLDYAITTLRQEAFAMLSAGVDGGNTGNDEP